MWRLARLAVFGVVLAASGCSFGGDDDGDAETLNADYVVSLMRLGSESEQTAGTVGLSAEAAGRTLVEIVLLEPATGRSAEIRGGNCDVRGGDVAYGFPPLVEGRSQRVVDVPLRELRRAGYLVLVHDAEGIGGVCGDLAHSLPPGTPT